MTTLVIDTSAFFKGAARLRQLLRKEEHLATVDLVIFEFMKVTELELKKAKAKKNHRREKILLNIQDRFPKLLKELEIEVRSPDITLNDIEELHSLTSKGNEAGDAMIWLKMQKLGWNTIVTDDTDDWKRLGPNIITT
ncbi:MAG: type II toxin-antitoxin system VapC family toxin [Thaumarchaeota archaeon]|nr:type II toxin-antitoxin system VapC family toxin [Nitrososphaerota archaeon]